MALMPEHQIPHEQIDGRFMLAQGGKPSEEQLAAQREVRELIHYAAKVINTGIADSREKSLALTQLEDALMWAGKAIFKH